jgi:LPS sulfotransferase NodH
MMDGLIGDRGYAICTSPRSGSNLLCQILSSTERLGHPLEYFNGPGRQTLTDPAFPDDPHEQVRWIRTKGATANGVYGLKLFAFQHDQIASRLAWTAALPRLRYIYLEREDLLGQALSWVRGIQTRKYRSTSSATADSAYDRNLIQTHLNQLVRERARWSLFFARTGITPERLTYDKLVEAPQAVVDQVARLMEIGERAIYDASRIDLAIQRDEVTVEWRKRFIAECGNPDFVDPL